MAAGRQRILVISQSVPHPTRGASTVLYYAYLAALKASGHETLHLCLNDKAQGAEWVEYLNEIRPDDAFRAEYAQLPHFYSINRRALRIRPTLPDPRLIDEVKRFQPDTVVCFDILAAAVAQDIGFRRMIVWFGDLQYRSHWYNAVYDFKAAKAGSANSRLSCSTAFFGSGFIRRFCQIRVSLWLHQPLPKLHCGGWALSNLFTWHTLGLMVIPECRAKPSLAFPPSSCSARSARWGANPPLTFS